MPIRYQPTSGYTVLRHEPDDQASGLRRLLGDRSRLRTLGLFGPDAHLNALAGANLALALAQRGNATCLIDEAPGPHNAIGQFGLSPGRGLADVLHNGTGFDDALLPAAENLHLLPAEHGLTLASDLDERYWNRTGAGFVRRDWDWLLLAAPDDDRASLALTAPLRLLVVPPQKARLTEAYAILKAAHHKQPDARWLLLAMNAGHDSATGLATSLNEAAQRFLGVELGLLGAIPGDAQFDRSVRSMRPLLEAAPASASAQALRQAADSLHDVLQPEVTQDVGSFWQRLGLFSRLSPPPNSAKRHVQPGRLYG